MKMTAAVLYEQGKPRPFADSLPLQVETVDLEGPGPGEVLVQIAGAGLCHSDLSTIQGLRARALPAVAGHEAAGIVREVGRGVRSVAPDDHVAMVFVASCGACGYCRSGRPNLCESSWQARAQGTLQTGARRLSIHGRPLNHYSGISAFAEYAVVAENSLVRITKQLPLHSAAIFGCAVITGVGAVMNTAGGVAGKAVAVVGLGGVGLAGLLGAVQQQAQPLIAVDMNPAKLALARELGATHAFAADDPDCVARVREVSGGGVEVTFEMAGSIAAMGLAYKLGRRGSALICVGLPPATATFAVPVSALVSDERVIQGSYMGGSVPTRDIPRYVELALQQRLPVERLLSHQVDFAGLNAAFDRLDDGASVRQVLRFL
ncbi:MAG: alcohol dehydrogenase catalytic domain-containing protein [Candidatus Lambdaproteobacteria bacterium]|nr:alcohol dehydrogenase catalytic domain-containing protein [Candidatus Lambdaproteobacteria bacterium]